ncbi:MAG: alpha/beta fold hydrolase [Bilophila wadsworthia]
MQSLERLGPFFPGGRIGFLLVHGLAGTPAEMKILGKRLNRYGFTVLCPQLAGHCASEEELITTCWSDWSRSVEDAFDALSRHMDAVFVGGLSAGAVLSLRHAQRYPGRARGLALYSTTLRYDGWTIPKLSFLLPLILKTPYFGKRYRFEEAFPYGIMDDKLRGRILAQMQSGDAAAAGFTATPGASLKQLWGLVAAVKRDLPSIKTPTLIVHAGNDDIASARSNALYVRDHIGGPTELLLLDRSYHMVTIDQERNVVGDATARFAWNLLSDAERERLAAVAREPVPAAPETSAQSRTPPRHPASSAAEGWKSGGGGGAMTALIVFLWIANMLVDTGGQLFFKAAASEHTAGAGGLAHWKRMASRPWLWFGICCYVLEFFVWMAFLSQVELSVGVMLGSFNIVVIMLAGRLFFKEKLTRWRVTGISLITLGVAIVGVGG